MRISNIQQNQSFGNLIISDKISERLQSEPEISQFTQRFNNIKKYIEKNKLDKKRNVDIRLDYKDGVIDRFYSVVSSKKQGIPIHPSNTHYIKEDTNGIKSLKTWVANWNYAYSEKVINALKKLNK